MTKRKEKDKVHVYTKIKKELENLEKGARSNRFTFKDVFIYNAF